MEDVRVSVLGIVQRDREYLVQRLVNPSGEPFYRPIGGGIEFRESSRAALEREFREELDLAVTAGPAVGTIENRFTWNGQPRHELLVLRTAELDDESRYERERFEGTDGGGAVEYEATWHTLDELRAATEPLYPEGIGALLRGEAGEGRGHVAGSAE